VKPIGRLVKSMESRRENRWVVACSGRPRSETRDRYDEYARGGRAGNLTQGFGACAGSSGVPPVPSAPSGRAWNCLSRGLGFSVNMISTITNEGKVRWMTYSGKMTAGFARLAICCCLSRRPLPRPALWSGRLSVSSDGRRIPPPWTELGRRAASGLHAVLLADKYGCTPCQLGT
jgi:hypothetical protein